MKNNIMYYYNINIDILYQKDNYYYFYINNIKYELAVYTRDIKEQNAILDLNRKMINSNMPVDEIILNKDNYVITFINNIPYVLSKKYIDSENKITLNDILFISNYNYEYNDILKRDNWDKLWSMKIDYFEYHINQNGKKYPILVDSFNYYVGLAENAISYVRNTIIDEKKELTDNNVVSHRKININSNINSLYDPLNIIVDHKSRDIAEYIKSSFFNNNSNIFNELDRYFMSNYYSPYGIRLLFARVLYPSYYFDLYESIIQNKIKESEILNITSNSSEYEIYLKNIFYYLSKFYNIPKIDWLKKVNEN